MKLTVPIRLKSDLFRFSDLTVLFQFTSTTVMGSTIGSNMAQPEPEHFTACFSNFETIEDFAVFIENFFPKAYGVNGLAWAIESTN